MPDRQNGLLLATCVYSSETSRLAARGVWHLGRLLIHSAMFFFLCALRRTACQPTRLSGENKIL